MLGGFWLAAFLFSGTAGAQELPELTAPVNDFAGVIDPATGETLDALLRSLQRASGDVVVVAAVETFAPFADIREYAVRLFENRGRGIGQRGRDNGLLVVLAVSDRQVWIEVGYDLEAFITDGFAGETSRQFMIPEFRRGDYGAGVLAGVSRIVSRIAERRNVSLEGVPPDALAPQGTGGFPVPLVVAIIIILVIANALSSHRGGRRGLRGRWGAPVGGWHSGVGPFGGGFGGFGGGFGGFGGGRSGGGGGGGSW